MDQKTIEDTILGLYRKHLELAARLKALESVVFERMPASERDAWLKICNQQANRIFQQFLENVEKKSPSLAAMLDNRGPDDLEGIEDPLT